MGSLLAGLALVALVALVSFPRSVSSAAVVPNFKYAQTDHALLLTLSVACEKDTLEATFLYDWIKVSCTALETGELTELSFGPREDILPSGSQCELRGRSNVFCRVVKRFPHKFDRLAWDMSSVRGFASIDWKRWQESSEDEAEEKAWNEEWESAYDGGSANDDYLSKRRGERPGVPYGEHDAAQVAVFTPDTLASAVQRCDAVVVDASMPWCDDCGWKRGGFAEIAAELSREGEVAFGWLDAREYRDLGRALGAHCSGSCEFAVLRRDEGGIPDYTGLTAEEAAKSAREGAVSRIAATPQGPEPLKRLIRKFLAPLVTRLSEVEGSTIVASAQPAPGVYAILQSDAGSRGSGEAEFVAAARALRVLPTPSVQYFIIQGSSSVLEVPTPSLLAVRPSGTKVWRRPPSHYLNSIPVPSSEAAEQHQSWDVFGVGLQAWMGAAPLALIGEYSEEARDAFDALGLPVVHAFVSLDSDETDLATTASITDGGQPEGGDLPELYKTLAENTLTQLGWLRVVKNSHQRVNTDFAIRSDGVFPTIGVSTGRGSGLLRYRFPPYRDEGWDPQDEEVVLGFLADVTSGIVSPVYRTQQLHGSYAHEKGKLALTKSWSEDPRMPVTARIARVAQNANGFSVACFDFTKNEYRRGLFGDINKQRGEYFLVKGRTGGGTMAARPPTDPKKRRARYDRPVLKFEGKTLLNDIVEWLRNHSKPFNLLPRSVEALKPKEPPKPVASELPIEAIDDISDGSVKGEAHLKHGVEL